MSTGKQSIDRLSPYVQGKSALEGITEPLKLSSNESLYGPSPKAISAMNQACASAHYYPDGAQTALRKAIAQVHNLSVDQIICGNGSDELISLLMKAYVAPGDDVVVSQYSFVMATIHAAAMGANVIDVPEADLAPDVDALLAAVTPRTKVVVLATPNNPVGKYIPAAQLQRLRDDLPSEVILLVDSAYGDYVTADDYDDGCGLIRAGTRTVMTRTFSKLYGLSGLRVGWAYLPRDVHTTLEKIRTPFNTNGIALAAAEAAVLDTEYAATIRAANAEELEKIRRGVSALDVQFIESVANFYLLDFSQSSKTAADVARHLEANGIIPRDVGAGGPDGCLRITVGRPQDNDAVLAALNNLFRA